MVPRGECPLSCKEDQKPSSASIDPRNLLGKGKTRILRMQRKPKYKKEKRVP